MSRSSDTRGDWQPTDGLLLEVDDLHVEFRTRDGVAKAINGVSFDLHEGETVAILGESGSGKSVTAQAIMGILDSPPGFITGGELRYCGKDMLAMTEEQRRRIRGPEISMVFQDALSALNPVFSVGWQIAEMFRKHRGMNKCDALAEAIKLMERVQIPARCPTGEGLSAPVLRRHATAHHDRHGDRSRSGRADRRRTDHGPRRDGSGPDHAAPPGPPGRAQDGPDPDHPRPRRGRRRGRPDRGDVCRPDRRAVGDLRALSQAGPPLHQGPAGLDPAAGPEGSGAGRHRWSAAQPHPDPAGLRVQSPLPVCP